MLERLTDRFLFSEMTSLFRATSRDGTARHGTHLFQRDRPHGRTHGVTSSDETPSRAVLSLWRIGPKLAHPSQTLSGAAIPALVRLFARRVQGYDDRGGRKECVSSKSLISRHQGKRWSKGEQDETYCAVKIHRHPVWIVLEGSRWHFKSQF